ncbi:MAG: hypothetical protein GF383_01725 [Candidatus Lokiarchaeota archaeon]|nr:hypothetical protein [Candidatus Lokiarchaeota archaeon]MBD3338026.1 hypothetical protein [Candidatus Lokiarchaeota archaeon]
MIKSILVCDSEGYVFYSRIFDKDKFDYDSTLLGGFITAIATVGRELFKEEIATISFGYNDTAPNIVVLYKEFFHTDKKIYFVFITKGDIDLRKIKDVCTNIFIENKNELKATGVKKNLQDKINKVIQLKLVN